MAFFDHKIQLECQTTRRENKAKNIIEKFVIYKRGE